MKFKLKLLLNGRPKLFAIYFVYILALINSILNLCLHRRYDARKAILKQSIMANFFWWFLPLQCFLLIFGRFICGANIAIVVDVAVHTVMMIFTHKYIDRHRNNINATQQFRVFQKKIFHLDIQRTH